VKKHAESWSRRGPLSPEDRGVLDAYERERTPRQKLRFAEELAIAGAAIAVADAIKRGRITQHELGRAIGVSDARVSQMLSGRANMTTRTMARIAHVLGHRLVVKLVAI
jgi:predicted XRE-type DNA-binding protein